MNSIRLGGTGLTVSRLGLGGQTFDTPVWRDWRHNEEQVCLLVRAAVEAGVNFFDASGLDEAYAGRALSAFARRDECVVAIKWSRVEGRGANDNPLSRTAVFASIDAALQRLQMDYVDLCQIDAHSPPNEEVMEALADIVRAGKARFVGAFATGTEPVPALRLARAPRMVCLQNRLDFLLSANREALEDMCATEDLALLPWSPMGRPYGKGLFDSAIGLQRVAREIGAKPAVTALAWALTKPYVTAPMIGVADPGALQDALAALSLKLDARTLTELEALPKPHNPAGQS